MILCFVVTEMLCLCRDGGIFPCKVFGNNVPDFQRNFRCQIGLMKLYCRYALVKLRAFSFLCLQRHPGLIGGGEE